MITEKQIARVIQKLHRFENMIEDKLFIRLDEIEPLWYPTSERLHDVPDKALFTAMEDDWGGAGNFCWFLSQYTPKQEHAGQKLYVMPDMTGYEGFLWVDGEPYGIFTRRKPIDGSRGNHYCALLTPSAESGRALEIALEYYAGTECPGTQPFEKADDHFQHRSGNIWICKRDELIFDFLFDLKTLTGLYDALEPSSFRRADIAGVLFDVSNRLYLDPENVDEKVFRERLTELSPLLKKALDVKNSASAPVAGLIGHSHMDTAWLWPIDETIKKCARTYANQLALMEQYPEYLFIQSSAYHSEMIRRHYPSLFERIKERIADGRYEPNGGVWVECDCNIVSGESLTRQFLWGQLYTKEHFGYTADAFWLPDTFGYSAAIPQIMEKSGVKYFLTTKMSWNDQNEFPYETFYWEGIDGTRVLSHLNRTHIWPDPVNLSDFVVTGKLHKDPIREKTVNRRRLISFGYGDGGGGPMFEMLESARRVRDLDGLPRAEYTTVSSFMQDLEANLYDPSVYTGELYLELHRGTLTNHHQIKRNMRKAEVAVHNLEYASVRRAMLGAEQPDPQPLRPIIETMLVNQFHDILPGTCIPPVHRRSVQEMSALFAEACEKTAACLRADGENTITISNTLSFARNDVIYLDASGIDVPDVLQQRVDTLTEGSKLAVSGMHLPSYASVSVKTADHTESAPSPFSIAGNKLETPHATVTFNEDGTIVSFLDKNSFNRELCGSGYPLNTFLMAEDVPLLWDNWDVDADIEYKLEPVSNLISREIVSDGCVELRIRSTYQISAKSTIKQDMVFYADSPAVRFETVMDWHDKHRFLKTAFDTSVQANAARHEIQFGNLMRPTSRSTDVEKAKFEVCCHKYTDLSESRYGISLLNDCKYGVSVHGGQIRLSLHKGGQRPDNEDGDMGSHICTYVFLPHTGGFSAESVVRPSYCLNYAPVITKGGMELPPLLDVSSPTVIAETVKPCEKKQNGFIVRLYECEGSRSVTNITVPGAKRIVETNILEDALEDAPAGCNRTFDFHPFEIKTLLIEL